MHGSLRKGGKTTAEGAHLGLSLRDECKFGDKWKEGHFGNRKNTGQGNLMLGVYWELEMKGKSDRVRRDRKELKKRKVREGRFTC